MKFIYIFLLLAALFMTSFSQQVSKASVSGKSSKIFIQKIETNIPADYNIYPACPNVFGPNTKIKIDVPQQSDIIVNIYDRRGRFVSNLVTEFLEAGVYSMDWEPVNNASGVYKFELISGSIKMERMIALAK